MTKDEALKLALEALEYRGGSTWLKHGIAVEAIKEALDECDEDELIIQYHEATIKRLENRIDELMAQPAQEPVAVVDAQDDGYWADILPDRNVKVGQFLYAIPPQRPWVGLTEEEVNWFGWHGTGVRAIEAKLKEKNT